MFTTKFITFILQALLVILAVVVFSFFDPFSIFNSKKLTMKDTPTIVTSIKSIGKLITSEYYGEVIKSSGEALEESVDSAKRDNEARLINMQQDVLDALNEIRFRYDSLNKSIKRPRQLYREFKKEYHQIAGNPDYEIFLRLVKEHYEMTEKEFLYYFYKNEEAELEDVKLKKKATPVFANVVNAYVTTKYANSNSEERRIANNSLVLLGRGWVKVGFDFSNFDEKHFSYLPDRNLIRLTHHQPEIISATINPWFIPERKMKGFEYLYIGKTIDKNPDNRAAVKIIQDLKTSCLDNLINDAIDAGIMEEAEQQAELSLGHFFSLLLEKDITVEIYADPMDAFLTDLFKDKKISPRDIRSADSLVGKYCKESPDRVLQFLREISDTLKMVGPMQPPWEGAHENWEIMSFYHRIAEDGFCTPEERDSVIMYVRDTIPDLKDYLYYALHDSLVLKNLRTVKYNDSKISEDNQIPVRRSRKANLKLLLEHSLNLRRYLTAREIRRCDSIVGGFVSRNEIEKAYAFASETEKYMDEPEPWKGAGYNWQVLSIYQEIRNNHYNQVKADQAIVKVPVVPATKEYFYYLFYQGGFTDSLDYNKKLLTAVTQTTPVNDNVLARKVTALKSKVRLLQKNNIDSLKHYSKQIAQ